MAAKHIYFVRHGETAYNRRWVHQSLDVPLNERGKRQARAVARTFAEIPIDALLASDARRAQETAEPIAETTHCAIETDAFFHELKRSSTVVGTHFFSPRSIWFAFLLYLHAGDRAWHYADEENFQEFRARITGSRSFLAVHPGEHIVVVAHRGFINGFVSDVRHRFPISIRRLVNTLVLDRLGNGAITELSYDPSRATPWRVERHDDTRHLRGL
ncbi:MAG: histidine phosphatase family protein [Minisyncoccota bacterium]